MPYNLLLLPLVGGYIFITRTYWFRFFTQRADGYRILLNAALAGIVLMVLASGLVELGLLLAGTWSKAQPLIEWIGQVTHAIAPFPFSGRAGLAFALGVLGWKPINALGGWCHRREAKRLSESKNVWKLTHWIGQLSEVVQARRVIYDKADALEMMLNDALEQRRLILVTTANGKVYMGMLVSNFNPAFPLEDIAMLPLRSGYRHETEKRTIFTTYYDTVIAETRQQMEAARAKIREELPNLSDERIAEIIEQHPDKYGREQLFQMVIPRSEIQSVCYFDPGIYDDHFNKPRVVEPAALPAPQLAASISEPAWVDPTTLPE